MPLEKHHIKVIGRREWVSFPLLQVNHVEAKIDTGAYTCAIHCNYISIVIEKAKPILYIRLMDETTHRFEEFTRKKIKNSFGEMEERFIIKTLILLGRKKIQVSISLSDRGNMRYPVLIGRKLLKGKFMVDVNLIYTNGLRLHKVVKDIK